MATRDPFLVNWVKNAYSMEMALVPMLEKQTAQVQSDPELRRGLDLHLQKTRQHVELLKGCLQRMGENSSAIRPTNPITEAYGQPERGAPDSTRQTELLDYVTEAFEVASYRALSALAIGLGDHETSKVCDQILQDELTISQALGERLPGRSGTEAASRSAAVSRGEGAGGYDNVRAARASFDALNSGDMDKSEADFAPDYRAEVPGMPGELTREQNRAYFLSYRKAFPDLHFDIEHIIDGGDHVVVNWVGTGTHTGPLVGPDGNTIPATGRKARLRGSTSNDFKNGKITHSSVLFDSGDLMRQLGLMPGMAAGGTTNRSIVHIEIPAADRAIAAKFYNALFGWEHEDMGETMPYTTFKTGNLGGGFPDLGDMYEPGNVILYVASDDIDADLRRASSLGAETLVPKTEIPGMGWFGIITDPTGNRVGLFQV